MYRDDVKEAEERISYAVGHLSLGYIISKSTSKMLKTEINLPLIFTLSVIPDIDILIPFIEHRGPTHSILAMLIIFIPIFALYGKRATPYLLALIQHPLIGDYFVGGKIQLFWPITTNQYGIELGIKNPINITAETITFVTSILIMLKTSDIRNLLYNRKMTTITLIIPIYTLISPILLKFPTDVPIPLVPPHLILTTVFLLSIMIKLSLFFRKS